MSYRPFTYGFPSGVLAALAALILAGGFYACEEPEEVNCLQDTTSHDFVWQIDTLGDSGVLSDVAIINDTLVYAVGEIYIKDSTGKLDLIPYNAALWNGTEWTLKRINVSFRGNIITPPLEGIYGFSPIQIWMVGSLPIYGNGSTWTMYDLRNTLDPNISISKVWGLNPENLYFVGRSGSIAHYNGTSWQRLASGTTLDIRDVWGAKNENSGKLEILAVASNDQEKRLLRIQGTTVTNVSDDGLSNILSGIWFCPDRQYYVVGAGIHYKSRLDDALWSRYPSGEVTSYASGGVRGSGMNDVFVVGSFREIVHFNGSTWYNYRNEIPFGSGAFGSIAIKGNLVVTVGTAGGQPAAVIGIR